MKYSIAFVLLTLCSFNLDAQTRKALMIGIDGVRPDALVAAETPNMDGLMANGTYSLDALNSGITISGPGWSSLLTGVWPDKHGVTDNSFNGQNYENFPHLFQRIEEFNPDLNTYSISQWHPINDEIASGVADAVNDVDNHSDYVAEAAIEVLSQNDPDILFLHFDDVDHAGHNYGFAPDVENYIGAIETVDQAIGEVLTALYSRPTYDDEEWVIIVSTDHGGINYSHGGNTIEERQIFMIVSGDGIQHQVIEADSILTTVLPVENCMGDSTELYFNGSAYAEVSGSMLFDFDSEIDFTVECRVRTDQSGDVAIITDKDWDSGFNPGWVFSFNVNGGPWKVNVGDGTNRVDIEGSEIADGEWHMLSATFDRDGMLTIYEDGVQIGETSMADIGDISASGQIFMGADSEQDYFYNGYIAEARIFQGLLEPSTIQDWACSHLDGTHPDFGFLVSQWSMNDGQGSSLMNQGANAIGTTLVGAEWQNTADTAYVWEMDFSNTPRQVDFMVSAIEHLCIPILEEWELDGEVLATYCELQPNGIQDLQKTVYIYPNPTDGLIRFDSPYQGEFRLYDIKGKLALSRPIVKGQNELSLKSVETGEYVFELLSPTGESSTGRLMKE